MNRPFPQKKNEKRINENIIARELMVIGQDGEALGKMTRDAALNLAGSRELDLVEVGMQEGIPLVKILDIAQGVGANSLEGRRGATFAR
jgi:translation initiation factor IF-3